VRLLSIDEKDLNHWLEGISNGCREREQDLMSAVMPSLGLMAGRMLRRFPKVREWAEVDDIAQDAAMRLLRALRAMPKLTPDHFEVLALTQVRRQLHDQARQAGRKMKSDSKDMNRFSLEDSADEGPEPAETPAEPTFLDRWSDMHELVEKMPVREREAFSLTFYHNWTTPQIAELFQVDDRTIRRWYEAACDHLRQTMGSENPLV